MPTVADIMSAKPLTLVPQASLKDAVDRMVEKNVGSLYVVNANNVPLGVLTERELLQDLVINKELSKDLEVGKVMSRGVVSIPPEASVIEAARTMLKAKGRLAVTRNDEIIGVVTASDFVRVFSTGPENRSISSNATQKVKTLDVENTTFDAIRLMYERRIGSVVVTEDGRPYGIFTERDILRILAGRREKMMMETKLGQVASRPLVTANLGVTAMEAASIMKSNKIKRLPLLKGDNLVAIITARDLVEIYVTTGLPAVTIRG